MRKHFIMSFTTTIILLIFLGFISIVKMMELSSISDKLYKHPFTVTNATKMIETNLVLMHSYMKDLLLLEDNKKLDEIVSKLNRKEDLIYKQFKIIFERYLGDKEDITKSYTAFNEWKPIREKVISLIKAKKRHEAIKLSSTVGAHQLENLNFQVNKLVEYAQNKAIFFHNNSLKSKQKSIMLISFLVCVILFILISIFIYVYINVNKSEKETKKYLHLIDQKIMSAKLDNELNIIDVSSALLINLGFSKSELINDSNLIYKNCKSFDKNEVLSILKSGSNWEGEISVIDKKAKEKWFFTQIFPIFSDDYNVIGLNSIFKDISSEKRVEELATRDALTNLYNRRYFDEIFPKQINISSRNNLNLVFAMIDIDNFKLYNDTYGHQAGDLTLIKVSEVLNSAMNRSSDYSFRVGGEEFALLFLVKNKDDALEIVENIRENVEKLQIKHIKNGVSKYVTISCGIKVILPSEDLSMEDIYYETDKALYKAKESGRNRSFIV